MSHQWFYDSCHIWRFTICSPKHIQQHSMIKQFKDLNVCFRYFSLCIWITGFFSPLLRVMAILPLSIHVISALMIFSGSVHICKNHVQKCPVPWMFTKLTVIYSDLYTDDAESSLLEQIGFMKSNCPLARFCIVAEMKTPVLIDKYHEIEMGFVMQQFRTLSTTEEL